jgi:hypothetical protein
MGSVTSIVAHPASRAAAAAGGLPGAAQCLKLSPAVAIRHRAHGNRAPGRMPVARKVGHVSGQSRCIRGPEPAAAVAKASQSCVPASETQQLHKKRVLCEFFPSDRRPHLGAGASASRTLILEPRPLLRVAPLSSSMAAAAEEALSNLT